MGGGERSLEGGEKGKTVVRMQCTREEEKIIVIFTRGNIISSQDKGNFLGIGSIYKHVWSKVSMHSKCP